LKKYLTAATESFTVVQQRLYNLFEQHIIGDKKIQSNMHNIDFMREDKREKINI